VGDLLHLPLLRELNIGHAIVSRAVLVGFERAVRDMKTAIAG
jgi:pyridoxine 5-phosphate synthase